MGPPTQPNPSVWPLLMSPSCYVVPTSAWLLKIRELGARPVAPSPSHHMHFLNSDEAASLLSERTYFSPCPLPTAWSKLPSSLAGRSPQPPDGSFSSKAQTQPHHIATGIVQNQDSVVLLCTVLLMILALSASASKFPAPAGPGPPCLAHLTLLYSLLEM